MSTTQNEYPNHANPCEPVDTVLDRERSLLAEHKKKPGSKSAPTLQAEQTLSDENKDKQFGLALSGGGIRSASFSLGVVQALLKAGRLGKVRPFDELFDYLSTVSGGGYLGSTLTWLKSQEMDLDQELNPRGQGVRTRRKNRWLDYVRQHGSYLKPNGISSLSLLSVALRNILLSLTYYFLLLVLFFLGLRWIDSAFVTGCSSNALLSADRLISIPSLFIFSLTTYVVLVLIYPLSTFIGSFKATERLKGVLNIQALLGLIWLVLLFTGIFYFGDALLEKISFDQGLKSAFNWWLVLVYAIGLVVFFSIMAMVFVVWGANSGKKIPSINYSIRLSSQRHAGKILGLILMTGVVSVIPILYDAVQEFGAGNASALAGGLGVSGAIYQFIKGRGLHIIQGLTGNMRIILTSFLLIMGLLLGAYSFVCYVDNWSSELINWIYVHYLLIVAIAVIFGLLINMNYFGIGRMYRDRLMETFMPNKSTIRSGAWAKASEADQTPITEYRKIKPYHIVNTNIVLVDSQKERFRGRGGDNFIITPLYCGCEATDYIPTSDWLNDRMNLPTAVAISGAAVNPHTAPSGQGISRNRLVSFLMAIMQIRLGYWAPHPNQSWLSKLFRPNYLIPGIRQGLLGRGLHSKSAWYELTDGGHFDNTGVYELVRRQLDVIVLSLANADSDFEFESLANVIQKVRIDFGVDIEIDKGQFDQLIPDETGLSDQGFITTKIHYRGINKTGDLIIMAASPVKNMPLDLVSYKKMNPKFPHEPTFDQFYDEEQLEAYRRLGQLITQEYLSSPGCLIK